MGREAEEQGKGGPGRTRRRAAAPPSPLPCHGGPRPNSGWPVGRPSALAVGLLVLAGLASYSNSFSGPFIFDDTASIVENPSIRSWEDLRPLFPPSGSGETVGGRPVLNLTLAINHALGGLRVEWYHATNLLVHLMTSLVLFALLWGTLCLPTVPEWLSGRAYAVALGAALLFVVHPLQTESVTYIVQRCEALAGLFYLLTLYGVLRSATSDRPWAWGALAALACLLGVGSKEVVVSAPLVALVYDRAFLAGSWGEALRKRWGLYLGLFLTWLPLAALVVASGGRGGTAGFSAMMTSSGVPSEVTPLSYFLAQPAWIVHYLRLSVAPWPLALDYGERLGEMTAANWAALAAVTLLGLTTAWALWREPRLGLLGLVFFAVLGPTSSFIPVATQVAAEHRMYLPLAAVLVALVVGAAYLDERLQGKAGLPLLVGLGCVAVLFGSLTYLRNRDYQTELSIWEDAAAKVPGNPRPWANVGTAYGRKGEYAKAAEAYRVALDLEPGSASTMVRLSMAEQELGNGEEAVRLSREAVATGRLTGKQYLLAGQGLQRAGLMDEALAAFEESNRLAPNDPEVPLWLGAALLAKGRAAEAVAYFEAATQQAPEGPRGHMMLGLALLQSGRPKVAVRPLRVAAYLSPRDPRVYVALGDALAAAGRREEAAQSYREALRRDPKNQAARRGLAGLGVGP